MIENKLLIIRRSKLSTENVNIDTLSSLYREYLFTINIESHKHWKSMDTLVDAYSFHCGFRSPRGGNKCVIFF